MLVHETDANTDVKIAYRSSPDGLNWMTGANDLFASSGGIADGMNGSTAGVDISFVAKMLPTVSVQGSAAVAITLSAWIVLKPF